MTAADRAFLAGLVAGEAHFAIRPNNAGQSWTCSFALALRDDDAPLLADLRAATECGELRWIPARKGSRPQTCWVVRTMSDCKRLVSALGPAPLVAKKAAELAIWTRAVETWTDTSRGAQRWSILAQHAHELGKQRLLATPAPPVPVDITRVGLERFLAGFTTAEGHFGATEKGHPTFVINLRVDDRHVLDCLSTELDVGYVRVRRAYRSRIGIHVNPLASWCVTHWPHLRRLASVFERCPPRGRKADAYAAWRELVAQAGDVQARRRLVARLRAARQYRPGARVQHRHRDQHRSRHACKEALRRFAAEHNGPYTSTAYERFRKTVVPRDKMPTRMTVVRAFGSWSAALDACELSRDGCRAPETVERVRSSNLARSRASREATREQIAAAIRACRLSVGRWPTAMEFLRWRLRNLPRSPTQGTVYRAFSGGWQEAVAYAQAGLENRKDTGDQDPLTTGR